MILILHPRAAATFARVSICGTLSLFFRLFLVLLISFTYLVVHNFSAVFEPIEGNVSARGSILPAKKRARVIVNTS